MENAPTEPMVVNADRMAQRLMQRAYNRDGLPEIAAGLALLASAGLLGMQVLYPRGSIVNRSADFGFALLIPVLILGSQWAIKQVRRRYLIERVGYVVPKPVNRLRVGAAFCVALLTAVAVAFAAQRRIFPPDGWILAEIALVLCAMAVLNGRSLRFVIGGVLVAVAGVLIALRGASLDAGMAMLFGFAGALALLSGSVVLLRFLREPTEACE